MKLVIKSLSFAFYISSVISVCAQNLVPISVSGFNEDVIAEGDGNSALTTTTREMDAASISNYVLCTRQFADANSFVPPNTYGLPNNRILDGGNKVFRLADYAANNALYLLTTEYAELILDTAGQFSNLSILCLATEGSATLNARFKFSDGTSQVSTINVPDWFANNPTPFSGFGRIKRENGPFFQGVNYEGAPQGKPSIFIFDLVLPCSKTLTSIDFQNTSSGVPGSGSNRAFVVGIAGTKIEIVPQISISANKTNICQGQAVQFTANFSVGGTDPQFRWFVNGAAVTNANASTFSTTTLTQGAWVKCRLTSNAECVNPAVVFSDSIQITVNPNVVPAIGISSADSTVCQGDTVYFTSQIQNGGSAPKYDWFVNGTRILNHNKPNYKSANFLNGARVKCRLTSNAECINPASIFSDRIQVTVRPKLLPAISISSPDVDVCQGTPIRVKAAFQNGGIPVFEWYVNNQLQASALDSFEVSNPGYLDSIRCKMKSTEECLVKEEATSNSLVFKVTPVFQIAFQSLPDSVEIKSNSIPLSATPTGGSWSGNGIIGNQFSPAYAGLGGHWLKYRLPENNCTPPDSILMKVFRFIFPCELIQPNLITPNGDDKNDVFFIGDFNTDCIQKAELQVFDRRGKEVHSASDYKNDWGGKDLNPGV